MILAFIAYPPLYYSIKETVEKESRPIEYTSPRTVPFLSLQSITVKNLKTEPGFPLVLEAGLDQLLSESGNLVYLGVWDGLTNPNRQRTEFILSGELEILDSSIAFTPKLEWLDSKKKFKGKPVQVSFEEIGELLPKAYMGLTSLLNETFRLERIQKDVPNWATTPTEILSESEWQELIYQIKIANGSYYLETKDNLSDKKSSIVKTLYMKSILLKKSEDLNRELWKNLGGNQMFPSIQKSKLAFHIADFYFERGELTKALEFALASKKEREAFGKVYHPEYCKILNLIGNILVRNNKKEEAIFFLTSAKEMYDTLGLSSDETAVNNRYLYGLVLADLSQLELANYSLSDLKSDSLTKESQILFHYNLSLLDYRLASFTKAKVRIAKQTKILSKMELTNHDISLYTLNLIAAIELKLGNWNVAKSSWESIVQAKSVYNIEDKPYYRYALFNLALIEKNRNNLDASENYYKQYTRITSFSQIQNLESEPIVGTQFYQDDLKFPEQGKFLELEEKTIKSYTGRYIFYGQDEEIRARTYENRLEDTNLFLSDLIEENQFKSKNINRLKKRLFGDYSNFSKGNQIVFFDIGPALNHPEYPGVTSLAVAKHFPEMEVVLWELPTEVNLFLLKVKPEKKDFLYSFKNIRIFSADGVGDFESDYQNEKNWILRNRPIPKLKGKTIILRAANSIDIYEPFTKIEPHFESMAKILKENAVLYFFNRSILLKPKGSEKFTLIGNQSIRGFHHNFQSLDRNGEPPYTILTYSLPEEE